MLFLRLQTNVTVACMRLRQLGKGQSVSFLVPQDISTSIRSRVRKHKDEEIFVEDTLCWAIGETWSSLSRSMPLWAIQGRRYENHKDLLKNEQATLENARGFLEDEAQSLEVRYQPESRNRQNPFESADWDSSNENISKIVSRCLNFGVTGFNDSSLQEEQEVRLVFSQG